MEKLKVQWTIPLHDQVSNALGYNTVNMYLRKYCQEMIEFDNNADIALTITPADLFKPVPNKKNILLTMWEFLDLPQSYTKAINKADAIIVPCSFCRDVFRRYTPVPIYVCWLGVESELYPYYKRELPVKYNKLNKFRFLWVGAPNPRKGYPLVLEAIKLFEKIPNVEIYIKTTMPIINWWGTIKSVWKNRKEIFRKEKGKLVLRRMFQRIPKPSNNETVKYYGKYKNIIFDTRKLSFDKLVGLYNSAHSFLFPSLGEGWGLTLTEAMATGLPCLAPPVTGIADFFDDKVGYPIAYEIRDQILKNYDLTAKGYVPDTNDFVRKMFYVIKNYGEALRLGKAASARIHNKFTWDKSAQRLCDIVREVYKS